MPTSARRSSPSGAQQIAKLGQFPNVYIKLGGLGMPSLMGFEMGRQDYAPSSEQLAKAWRPYIETCIDAFGPDRSMFESNFPVDKGMCSYPICGTRSSASPTNYSNDEKNAMFHNTALKFYRLVLTSPSSRRRPGPALQPDVPVDQVDRGLRRG